MSVTQPKALVLAGDGINCEIETAQAFRQVGFDVTIRHINDLISDYFNIDRLSSEYIALALPGGFSFGDDLESGRVLALKIRKGLNWDLHEFANRGGLVIGICNGFQALIRMGTFGTQLSITQNSGGEFIDDWVTLSSQGEVCVWLKGVGTIDLPVRHGEGKVIFRPENRNENLEKLKRNGMDCLKYDMNPNGSEENIAGLCDSSGRILGLMPHPEAFLRWSSHPSWTSEPDRAGAPGEGLLLFENAFYEARSST